MKIINKIKCFYGYHDFFVLKEFTPKQRMVACSRCKKIWAMNDDVKAFLPWDKEFEELYFGNKPWSYKGNGVKPFPLGLGYKP